MSFTFQDKAETLNHECKEIKKLCRINLMGRTTLFSLPSSNIPFLKDERQQPKSLPASNRLNFFFNTMTVEISSSLK
jgi:hypothetical protein